MRGQGPGRVNAVARRGACPALSEPMSTGDGLLVRLNPVAAGLPPASLKALCRLAKLYGNGIVEVTARGSFQIRGLTPGSAAVLATDVDALGIAVRSGVPVETGRLAGIDPDEVADPRPLADHLRAAIASGGFQGRLGPKVSVVIDGGGNSSMDTVAADVRATAGRPQGTGPILWRLAMAGDAASATPVAMVSGADAAQAVVSMLLAIAERGPDARARDLLQGDSQLPRFERNMAGTPGGLGTGRRPSPSILPLTDGRFALSIALPFGQADAGTVIALMRQADACGVSEIRLAPERTVLLLCATDGQAHALRAAASRLGFITGLSDPRRSISACPGAPACASGHIAARRIAEEAAPRLAALLDGSTSIHVSGCAKGCAHPSAASLTVVGGENGAGLVVGGTARQKPSAYIGAGQVQAALARIATTVASERTAGETVSAGIARLAGRLHEIIGRNQA